MVFMKKWLVLFVVIGGVLTLGACQNETSKSTTSTSESSTEKVASSESSSVASSSDTSSSDTSTSVSSEDSSSSEATVAIISSTEESIVPTTSASEQATATAETTDSSSSAVESSSVENKPVSSLDKDTKTILTTFLEYAATQPDVVVDYTTLTMTRKGQDVPLTLVLGDNQGMIRESIVNNQEAHQSTIANYTIAGETINITVTTGTGEATVYTKTIK